MLYLNALASCLLLFFSGHLLNGLSNEHLFGHEIIHQVTVFHPGMKQAKDCQLVERIDESGSTTDFYMEVESVICLNGLCKVVHVRIIWDNLGSYVNFELEDGVSLEKKDGALFSADDYDKLHQVLLNKQSIFDAYELGQIVDINKDNAGIDGISGATILTDESATVKGAAWTCYTLWHWANGEVSDAIYAITGRSLQKAELYDLLSKDALSTRLVLEQLTQRKMFDSITVDTVAKAMLSWEINAFKQGIGYLQAAPSECSVPTFKSLFLQGGELQRLLLLTAILDQDQEVFAPGKIELPFFVSRLNSFPEVNALLNHLEETKAYADEVNEQLLGRLTENNFIISRRVYWFLKGQNLGSAERGRLEIFGEKYSGRL